MSTVYYKSEIGKDNLKSVLEKQLSSMNVEGTTFLLKPNLVDPMIPKACSNPAHVQLVADMLKSKGAKEILVGDQPASYFYDLNDNNVDMHHYYERLGYTNIQGIRLIDFNNPEDLKGTNLGHNVHFAANKIDKFTAKTEAVQIPVRDISGLSVVSFALPKHHGNFNYSGVCKNLMGLVPQKDRMPNFHNDLCCVDDLPEFITKYSSLHSPNENNPEVRSFYFACKAAAERKIDSFSLHCHMVHIINAGAISGLVKHFMDNNPKGFYVLDGEYLLKEHEHEGTPVKTDFAAASENPVSVDIFTLNALMQVLDLSVPYIADMIPYSKEIEVEGTRPFFLPRDELMHKELFEDSHRYTFARVKPLPTIDPDEHTTFF